MQCRRYSVFPGIFCSQLSGEKLLPIDHLMTLSHLHRTILFYLRSSISTSDESFALSPEKKTKLAVPSPTKDELKTKLLVQKNKIKVLNQKLRRKTTKIKTLAGIYEEMKTQKMLKDNFIETLKEKFPGLSAEIITIPYTF